MSDPLSHRELGILLADAHGIATQLIESLSGPYSRKTKVEDSLQKLKAALSKLKSDMTTVHNASETKRGIKAPDNPYYPSMDRSDFRTQVRIHRSPDEFQKGKRQFSASDVAITLSCLAKIKISLNHCQSALANTTNTSLARKSLGQAVERNEQAKAAVEASMNA
jgi:hypothetical protein